MFPVIGRKRRIQLYRFARAVGSGIGMLLLASPAFAQIGGDRVSSFLSNTLSYAQGLGIFGAGFLVFGLLRAERCRFDSNPLHARSQFERSSLASNWRTGDL
jgi:hypothetical protein